MGTNYYLYDHQTCTCGDHHRVITKHIGKASSGRRFLFSTELGQDLRSVVYALQGQGVAIENEYGDSVSLRKFLDMVFERQAVGSNIPDNAASSDEVIVYRDYLGFEFISNRSFC